MDSDGSYKRRSMSRDEETVMIKETETTRENSPNTSVVICDGEGSREGSQEISVIKERHNPIIEGIVQPKVNKMTEELRAKVRAMLESKK